MMQLREYQKDDVARILQAWEAQEDARIMYQCPTGAGKTETSLAITQHFLDQGKQVIFLAHREELIDQTHTRAWTSGIPCCNTYRGCYGINPTGELDNILCHNVARPGQKRFNYGPGMSIQSIIKAWQSEEDEGSLLILDEAHHSCSRSWARIIKRHKGPILGLSATPWRLTKKEGFDHLFDTLICGPQASWLVDKGYLSPIWVWQSSKVRRSIRNALDVLSTGDYNIGESATGRIHQSMVEQPIQDWLENGGMEAERTIIYSANVKTAIDQADMLQALEPPVSVGIVAHSQEARLKAFSRGIKSDRKTVIEGLKDGSIKVVLNVNIITEGFDAPSVDMIVMGRPTKSKALAFQMIGRGMRVSEGKLFCRVIDSVENCTDPDIGLPTSEQVWSLYPRAVPSDMPPPSRKCMGEEGEGCGIVLPTAQQICPFCYRSQGSKCTKCHAFRMKFWDAGLCEHCQRADKQAEDEIESNRGHAQFRNASSFRDSIDSILGGGHRDVKRLEWLAESNKWIIWGKGHLVEVGARCEVSTKRHGMDPENMECRAVYVGPLGSAYMKRSDAAEYMYRNGIGQEEDEQAIKEFNERIRLLEGKKADDSAERADLREKVSAAYEKRPGSRGEEDLDMVELPRKGKGKLSAKHDENRALLRRFTGRNKE